MGAAGQFALAVIVLGLPKCTGTKRGIVCVHVSFYLLFEAQFGTENWATFPTDVTRYRYKI